MTAGNKGSGRLKAREQQKISLQAEQMMGAVEP
jgi:hypothetical protein